MQIFGLLVTSLTSHTRCQAMGVHERISRDATLEYLPTQCTYSLRTWKTPYASPVGSISIRIGNSKKFVCLMYQIRPEVFPMELESIHLRNMREWNSADDPSHSQAHSFTKSCQVSGSPRRYETLYTHVSVYITQHLHIRPQSQRASTNPRILIEPNRSPITHFPFHTLP